MRTIKTIQLYGKSYSVSCETTIDEKGNKKTVCEMPDDLKWATGYKTALKPAHEMIIVARAPRGKHTFADLALTYGTGSFDIDAGRIGESSTPRKDPQNGNLTNAHMEMRPWMKRRIEDGLPLKGDFDGQQGRYPANVLFSHAEACTPAHCADGCPVKLLADMSGESVSNQSMKGDWADIRGNNYNRATGRIPGTNAIGGFGDSGTAARFFFAAKAASWEREAGLEGFETKQFAQSNGAQNALERGDDGYIQGEIGINRITSRRNIHPTVKPAQLTEYLARLILPPPLDTPRRLLAPCAGVGSEMIGGILAGWDVVDGIEREAQYIPIGQARLKWWSQFASYDKAKERWDSEHRGAVEAEKLEIVGQLPLFRGDDLYRPAGKAAS